MNFSNLSLWSDINIMINILKKVFLNKYFIILVLFAVWMTFFDTNSLKRQKILNTRINEIKEMKEFYREEIDKNNKTIEELQTNPEAVEKLAREKYLMKKENEDIFIFEEDK